MTSTTAKTTTTRHNTNCCVHGCHSRKGADRSIHFHYFPQKHDIRVKIINALGVEEEMNRRKAWEKVLLMDRPATDSLRVCSKHFTIDDYCSEGILLKQPKLKRCAVPSVNLPKRQFDWITNHETSNVHEKRLMERRVEVEENSASVHGGKVCRVAVCESNTYKAQEYGEHTMFLRFPKDPKIKKKWVRRCYTKDTFSAENDHIYSKRFQPQDFGHELKARLPQIGPKVLKKTAIPSLMLSPLKEMKEVSSTLSSSQKRAKRAAEKERRIFGKSLTQNEENKVKEYSGIKQYPFISQIPTQEHILIEIVQPPKQDLLSDLSALQEENKFLKQKLLESEAHCKLLNDRLTLFNQQLKTSEREIDKKKKPRERWTDKELSTAFALRYFGRKIYIYLRKTLKCPLPHISLLQKLAANNNLRSSILNK